MRLFGPIQKLTSEFSVTDMGPLHHFLGISVQSNYDGLFLSQRQYVQEILSKANMSNCKPSSTPVDSKSKLPATDGPPFADLYYIALWRVLSNI